MNPETEKLIEFIKYLCVEIWNELSDGDTPDIDEIKKRLIEIGINPDEIFIF